LVPFGLDVFNCCKQRMVLADDPLYGERQATKRYIVDIGQ